MVPSVKFSWVNGLSYQEVWDLQTRLHKELVDNKLNRRSDANLGRNNSHYLLFCEHRHVYTLGKSGSMDHLLLSEKDIKTTDVEFFKINRGGDITYHGPGQITGYPIFDLEDFFTDVHKYVRTLEEGIIILLSKYGINGVRIPDYTGVWIGPDGHSEKFRKICAIGVHLSRWVSMHGFAFNVNTDLAYFDKIIPCGIKDDNKTVTSLALETGEEMSVVEVGNQLAHIFSELFNFKLSR